MRIKKGDNVRVLSGKDRGKTGKVIKVYPSVNRVIVENINLVKKHKKSRQSNEQSERITMPAPISLSNVLLICPKCSKVTRTGAKIVAGKKVRVCKKCEAEI